MEKQTVRRIKEAVRTGRVAQPFRAKQINSELGITWAGNFLAKHRIGNPRSETEHFAQIDKGLYRL